MSDDGEKKGIFRKVRDGFDKAVDTVNLPKKLGNKLNEQAEKVNDNGHRIGGTALGFLGDVTGALGGGVEAAANSGSVEVAAKSAGVDFVQNVNRRIYNFDNVADELGRNGIKDSRKEMRGEFEQFKEEYKDEGRDGSTLKKIGRGAYHMVSGRGDDESRALRPYADFKYAGGDMDEFNKLNNAAKKTGPDIDVTDYTDHKEAQKENPAAFKKAEQVLKPEKAMEMGGYLPTYDDRAKDGKMGEYKQELVKEQAEIKKLQQQEKAEQEKIEREERKAGKNKQADASGAGEQANPGQSPDMQRALAQAKGVETQNLQMRSDNTSQGCPEGNETKGVGGPSQSNERMV